MPATLIRRMSTGLLAAMLAGCWGAADSAPARRDTSLSDARRPGTTLRAYGNDADFERTVRRWAEASRVRAAPPLPPAIQSTTANPEYGAALRSLSVPSTGEPSITNVQTVGVDEGGIVKLAGDHLVILRRGRLFSVKVGDDALHPIAAVDAFAGTVDPRATWYDELLVAGRDIVVVGYSYARGGTEIGLFKLGDDGSITYRSTHHLRGNDYYSASNYASRLIGRRLVFYTPIELQPYAVESRAAALAPALRRWSPERSAGSRDGFQRIAPATRIYRTDDDLEPGVPHALHSVVTCDIGDGALDCSASAVLGPSGRVFHVARDAVYVWTAPRSLVPATVSQSAVFRLPLDGTAPSMLKTAGVPLDPLSFLEDDSGHLNVLLRQVGAGDGMLGAPAIGGTLRLLRAPLSAFGSAKAVARAEHYRTVPSVPGVARNRFIGEWLVYGGAGSPAGSGPNAFAIRYGAPEAPPVPVATVRNVQRIEALERNALLVGTDNDGLHFGTVDLAGGTGKVVSTYSQPGSKQDDSRTHAFFYRPDGTGRGGYLGLPSIAATSRSPSETSIRPVHPAAGVLYLRNDDMVLSAIGSLDSSAAATTMDGCRASCFDWYGQARPVFLGERVFALLGYELVEGILPTGAGRIVERRRIDFTPQAVLAGGRHQPF